VSPVTAASVFGQSAHACVPSNSAHTVAQRLRDELQLPVVPPGGRHARPVRMRVVGALLVPPVTQRLARRHSHTYRLFAYVETHGPGVSAGRALCRRPSLRVDNALQASELNPARRACPSCLCRAAAAATSRYVYDARVVNQRCGVTTPVWLCRSAPWRQRPRSSTPQGLWDTSWIGMRWISVRSCPPLMVRGAHYWHPLSRL
jgi:hypothetical protein